MVSVVVVAVLCGRPGRLVAGVGGGLVRGPLTPPGVVGASMYRDAHPGVLDVLRVTGIDADAEVPGFELQPGFGFEVVGRRGGVKAAVWLAGGEVAALCGQLVGSAGAGGEVAGVGRWVSEAEVGRVLNAVADEVLVAVGEPESGVRDGVNLVVNAVLHWLFGDRDAGLAEVVAACYSDGVTVGEVVGWIAGG